MGGCGRVRGDGGRRPRRATAAGYRQALELYGGELLPDDLYEDWGADRREGLRRLKVDLLLGLAVATVGDRLAVIEIYRQALAADPYNEVACLGLMGALAEAGDRAGTLRERTPWRPGWVWIWDSSQATGSTRSQKPSVLALRSGRREGRARGLRRRWSRLGFQPN